MKRVLEVMSAVAFLFALGIIGAVEHSNNTALIWWMIPCFAVMVVASFAEDAANTKKFLSEVVSKAKN